MHFSFYFKVEDPVEANIEKEEAKDVEIELEEILDPDVVDLRQFHPLGGIYHIDLLEMPPQPKAVKGWTLTQVPHVLLLDEAIIQISEFCFYLSHCFLKYDCRRCSSFPEIN